MDAQRLFKSFLTRNMRGASRHVRFLRVSAASHKQESSRADSGKWISLRCGALVIFTAEKRERRPYLIAETPKFLIGYDPEFSDDRDLNNCRRTSKIIKCACNLLSPFMDQPIRINVTFVLAAVFVRKDCEEFGVYAPAEPIEPN